MCFSALLNSGRERLRLLHSFSCFLGLTLIAAQAEIVIDGDFSDWVTLGQDASGGGPVYYEVTDPADLGDASGDLARIGVTVEGENLILTLESHGTTAPSVDETPEGKTNRYYYHWLVDTDNNAATGVSNATYENNPTGIEAVIGTELIIQFGWRDGAPNGIYAYDPLDPDEEALISDYPWERVGNAVQATIPLEVLGLTPGQTVAFSAFQEGASDGWATDFIESVEVKIPAGDSGGGAQVPVVEVTDPSDLGDSSGDLAKISVTGDSENLILTMEAHGVTLPSVEETPEGKTNRYYYHWLVDTDNNAATGVSNATYENNSTGIENVIGTEVIIQLGWRDGAPNGIYAYDPLDPDEEALISDYPWEKVGNVVRATIPYAVLGLSPGQTVAFSAFQEGASDGWATDFIESVEFKIPSGGGGAAPAQEVDDPSDLGDSSGDLAKISVSAEGEDLILTMSTHGIIVPSVEETPEGKTNRYYYHWLIDSDNNAATGVSNATYENNSTGVERVIGTEIIVQLGWRDGAPNGIYAYDPLDPDEEALISDYPWEKVGDTVQARIPYAVLGLIAGQTVSVSAFQEGASDGWATDFAESVEFKIPEPSGCENTNIIVVDDSTEDMLDPSGDIKEIRATTDGEFLYLGMTVESVITPAAGEVEEGLTNRYYYHWLVDSDDNAASGVSNATYENNPTGVVDVIGTEIVIQIGWRNGVPDGVFAYDPTDPDEGGLISEYEWAAMGDSFEAKLPLEALGLSEGQRVSISAFQEGASDGWATDWMESAELLLKAPECGGEVDCLMASFVDGYGFTVLLEDCEGNVIDPAEVTATLDGVEVPVVATKDGEVTTVTAQYEEWLSPGGEHALRLDYSGNGATDLPVVVQDYTVIPATYGVKSLDGVPPGFVVNVSQVSDFQTEDGASAHNYNLERAEKQMAGDLISAEGKPFYNEASESQNGWVEASTTVEGIINWSEDAPTEAGYFNDSATGQTDQPIPLIPGSNGSTNGIVIELLAYLELEAGYHRLGLNTIGGFKASMGPDSRDRLSPVLGFYEDAVRYSFLGDKYFDVLVPEAGFYPIRVLFTHVERTKEGASMELFSLKGSRRIAINDPDDPDAIKAYQFLGGDATYVSHVSPTPSTDYAKPNASIDVVIEQGGAPVDPASVRMQFDGAVVTPDVSTVEGQLVVRYFPGAMDWGSSHEVEFAYTLGTDPPLEREETFDFGVYRNAVVLPTEWASPVESGSEPGFSARVVQEPGPRGNSIAEAEKQLNREGTFSAEGSLPMINLGGGGLFQDDLAFSDEGLLGEATDYFSMEVLTHLHLTPGAYTFGVNSDDGFVASVGREATEKTVVLDGWDSGRGIEEDEPQDLFDVVVRQEGLYAFRLVYFQGTGGAAVEWYQYDRETETATLLNTEGAPAAYAKRGAEPMAFAGPRIAAPSRADFGSIPVTVANLPSGFIVHNTGGEALAITEPVLSGPDAGHFTLTDYPANVAPGEAGLFKVTFDPQGTPGGYAATLEMGTNDAAQATVTVELSAGALDPVGPIAHYALDETEGGIMRDRSGNQRDGNYVAGEGGITLGQAALADGTAVGFQGGAYASVSGAQFNRWEDFTLAAWIHAESADEVPQLVFGKGDPTSGDPNFALLFSSAGLIWFVGSEPEFASEPGVIQAQQTHHVVVSFNTSGAERLARLYVDGVVVAEKADPNFIATGVNEPLFVGAFNGAVALGGTLDDVQLYDRALTTEDIGLLYENPGQPLPIGDDPPEPGGVPFPEFSSVVWSEGGFQTSFTTEPGASYELQYSVSLEPGSWSTVSTIVGDGNVQTFADDDGARQALPAGFYRISGDFHP